MPESLFQKLLETEGSRYEYEINVLIALKKWGTEYLEIPIKTIYIGKNESSHFHPLRDGLRVFSRVIRYALSSLGCTLVDYVLYTVLNLLHVPVSISYIAAKGASSILNYVWQFQAGVSSGASRPKSVVLFALLVFFGMGVGSVSVKALTGWGLGKILSKLIVDIVLFFFNYFMQKYVVVPTKRRARPKTERGGANGSAAPPLLAKTERAVWKTGQVFPAARFCVPRQSKRGRSGILGKRLFLPRAIVLQLMKKTRAGIPRKSQRHRAERRARFCRKGGPP